MPENPVTNVIVVETVDVIKKGLVCGECITPEFYEAFKNSDNAQLRQMCIKPRTYSEEELTTCTVCHHTKLCPSHTLRAQHWGEHYVNSKSVIMCDRCCWHHIG